MFIDDGLVLSQIGPLFIVGLLGRSYLSLDEIKVWNRSELLPGGGQVTPIQEWRVGGNITLRFARFLARHEIFVIKGVLDVKRPVI